MTYSCSDFTAEVTNQLVALNLADVADIENTALEDQASLTIGTMARMSHAIRDLSGLLSTVLAALPTYQEQQLLPLDASLLAPIDPVLRDTITRTLRSPIIEYALRGPADRFMTEILDANETLTGIVDVYNADTLADVMYLYSAIHKGTFIEVEHPTESRIEEVVRGLPCSKYWFTFIKVAEAPAA